MDTLTRARGYLAQRGKNPEGFVLEKDGGEGELLFPGLTGPQRRRLRHKQCLRNHNWGYSGECRQPHVHQPGQRCVTCSPYAPDSATVLTAEGPRDWTPPKVGPGGQLVQIGGRHNGRTNKLRAAVKAWRNSPEAKRQRSAVTRRTGSS